MKKILNMDTKLILPFWNPLLIQYVIILFIYFLFFCDEQGFAL